MIGDRALQDVNDAGPACMVVSRAEDAARLDGHHAHAKLSTFHALDLAGKVDRCRDLHRHTLVSGAAGSLLTLVSCLTRSSVR